MGRSRSSNSAERRMSKGHLVERRGRKAEGRSVEEMNRKDDRSEGYHAHGFHRWAPEHETGRKKNNMPDQRPTQTTAAFHISMHREHGTSFSPSHTLTRAHHSRGTHTFTTLCIPLLTQSLHIFVTIHTIATNPTNSAVHSLSLRVMPHSLNQRHTTTRTIIKQTSTQSLSVAYLCTTSLVKSN